MNLLAVVGRIETNNDGRRVLGVTADYLHAAYGVLDRSVQADVRAGYIESSRGLLDVVNAYATGIYAVLPENDQQIDGGMVARVSLALEQADEAFTSIADTETEMVALQKTWGQALTEAIPAVGNLIGDTISGAIKAPAQALSVLLWPLAIVAGAVVVFMYTKKGALPA